MGSLYCVCVKKQFSKFPELSHLHSCLPQTLRVPLPHDETAQKVTAQEGIQKLTGYMKSGLALPFTKKTHKTTSEGKTEPVL